MLALAMTSNHVTPKPAVNLGIQLSFHPFIQTKIYRLALRSPYAFGVNCTSNLALLGIMARLTDLPNEIIHNIFRGVLPGDIENFAQACRRINSAAQPFLEDHRLLIRNYSIFDNKSRKPGSVYRLALEDGTDQRIGHYVIRFECMIHAEDPGDRYDEESLFPLLLHLLNLKTLSLDWARPESPVLLRTLERILLEPDRNNGVFSKLEKVRLISYVNGELDSRLVQAFSKFPSVRLLSTVHQGHHAVFQPTAPTPSLVTKLELWECYTSPNELHDFLRGFCQLQEFTYSSPFRSRPEDGVVDAFLIRNALLHAKYTLRKAVMTAPGRQKLFMGSLREFEALEELQTDWEFGVPKQIPPLAVWLPNSLRTLTIYNEKTHLMEEYFRLVEAAASWRSSQTSQLKKIEFWYRAGLDGSSEVINAFQNMSCDGRPDLFKAVGLTVTFAEKRLPTRGVS